MSEETAATPPSVREHLHSSIQKTSEIDDDMDGCMLKGWVCVAEWIDPEGRSWLTRLDGGPQGESLPSWQAQGYLHNSLFEGFGPPPDDEGDD